MRWMAESKICIDDEKSTSQVRVVCVHDQASEKIKLFTQYANEDMDIHISFSLPVNFCPFCGRTESKEEILD